jgi:hypothetical protein
MVDPPFSFDYEGFDRTFLLAKVGWKRPQRNKGISPGPLYQHLLVTPFHK